MPYIVNQTLVWGSNNLHGYGIEKGDEEKMQEWKKNVFDMKNFTNHV